MASTSSVDTQMVNTVPAFMPSKYSLVFKIPPLVPILSQLNPVSSFWPVSERSKVTFFLRYVRFFQVDVCLLVLEQTFMRISCFLRECSELQQSYLALLNQVYNFNLKANYNVLPLMVQGQWREKYIAFSGLQQLLLITHS
jgi:hypothetical protein